ncbi:hypothetical protein FLAG1_05045 [Fusarium langsethiae]|uniref:Uncharacterized protein n=1 Tax=Fusarium langsethiae TaxID=179993 RepID=A0A0M9EXT5_FUSLA|nr:hypothetical protein FLAG1_05045 [Fusarium langsethiae]GKU03014.1 unnamed protein product [Fusarium langsethiae]GKU19086.1 unnamed protein product [Fusarium langsethiae]
MAEQHFPNRDFSNLRSDLLAPRLVLAQEEKSGTSDPKDTKEELIEKVQQDLRAIAGSPHSQAQHENFRIPATEACRDLYNKLKEVRDQDGDLTEKDTEEIESLLKKFIRELDPQHPFLAEPKQESSEGTLLTVCKATEVKSSCKPPVFPPRSAFSEIPHNPSSDKEEDFGKHSNGRALFFK